MKKKVKQHANQIEAGALDRQQVLKDFSWMLDNQVCYRCMKGRKKIHGFVIFSPENKFLYIAD